MDSRGRAEPHLAVGRSSLLGRVQTGLKGGGMKDSDLTGDSSLARANQSMGICKSEGTVDRRLKSQVSQLLLGLLLIRLEGLLATCMTGPHGDAGAGSTHK